MKKSEDMCRGCYNDFYNGRNQMGIKKCWYYKNAKVIMAKRIPINQPPPHHQKPKQVLDCYNQQGYCFREE